MTATVNGQSITITDETLTVSESVGIYECDFTFDASWDTWNKTAVFEGAGATIEMIVVDNKAQIPWEVLKEAGWIKIGVYGTKGGEVKPTIWSDQIYVAAGTVPGSVEVTPTPSIYAQILDLANDAKDIAEDAQDTADDVASDWASVSATATTLSAGAPATVTFEDNTFAFGIPKGAKGDTGATGATGATPDFSIGTVSTLETGQSATATITGTAAAPVLNLGLPKGNKGDNGDVANVADAYSTSATYAVGDYCIYSSQLYRCTTAITTAEAWTAAHWSAVALGDDTRDLRSALTSELNGNVPLGNLIPNSYIATTGAVVPYNGWSATDFIPINGDEKRLIITSLAPNGGIYDAFYDDTKTFISGSAFQLVAGDNFIGVPNNAKYVRLSNTTASMQQTTIKWWVAEYAEKGSSASFSYTTTGEDCFDAFIDGNGNASIADAWKTTPYICVPFPDGGTIRVKSTINGNAGLAFYDKNQNCIYAITGNNASAYGITPSAYPLLRDIQVPSDTYYIRFCVFLDGFGSIADLYADSYGLNQLLYAIGEENQSMMHFNEDVLPTVNASANYGYHSNGYYNTNTRFCLFVTTDVHGQGGQLERAVSYMNQMPCFTCGVTLGDIQASDFADNDGTWYTDVIKTANKDWLTIIGNHDAGHNNDPSKVGTPDTVYQKFIAPNMQYAGATDTGKSYYYKDIDVYKIRMICLNDYDYTNNTIVDGVYVVPRYTEYFSQAQLDWLVSTLASTPLDYTVLIMLHNCPARATKNTSIKFNNSVASWYYESTQNGIITDIVDAWQNGSALSQTYPCTNTNLPSVTISADFTARGNGLFAGFLCGHAHADNVGTITAYPTQNVFTFSATAKGYYQNSDDDLPRQDGTKAADCVTALSIDTANKKVMITRIGSNISNILEKREPSVISYI